jgi:hypothetical protein
MVDAQSYDGPYARLLGEFVAVQVNIDAGAEIDSDDIDVLIQAEDMLAAADAVANLKRFERFESTDLTEVISAISDLNQGMRLEVPCMDASTEGVYEVDAPLPDRDKRMHERIGDASAEASAPSSEGAMQDRIVGASAEDAATSNGFHRPSPRPRPHRPYR